MSHTALHELGAHELLAGYRARTFSPLDVAQAVLAQIERWEPHIAATWLLRPELALAQARTSEARWARGEPCGALDGVPITVKENIATAGDPVPLGTRPRLGFRPTMPHHAAGRRMEPPMSVPRCSGP